MRERGEMREAKAPLIAEAAEHISHSYGSGSSGTGSHTSGGGGGWRGSRQYQRRSDALAYGDRYQKAAALVDLVGSLLLCLPLVSFVLVVRRSATLLCCRLLLCWELR